MFSRKGAEIMEADKASVTVIRSEIKVCKKIGTEYPLSNVGDCKVVCEIGTTNGDGVGRGAVTMLVPFAALSWTPLGPARRC